MWTSLLDPPSEQTQGLSPRRVGSSGRPRRPSSLPWIMATAPDFLRLLLPPEHTLFLTGEWRDPFLEAPSSHHLLVVSLSPQVRATGVPELLLSALLHRPAPHSSFKHHQGPPCSWDMLSTCPPPGLSLWCLHLDPLLPDSRMAPSLPLGLCCDAAALQRPVFGCPKDSRTLSHHSRRF